MWTQAGKPAPANAIITALPTATPAGLEVGCRNYAGHGREQTPGTGGDPQVQNKTPGTERKRGAPLSSERGLMGPLMLLVSAPLSFPRD